MQIKEFLNQNGRLKQLVEKYIQGGSLFTSDHSSEVDLGYLTIKSQCDDSSGEPGFSEIFSFDFALQDCGTVELKLYYNKNDFFGDAICLHEDRLTADEFLNILKNQSITYETYINTDVEDEGVIYLANGVMARFKIINNTKIVYQVECNFSLYPEFANGMKKTLRERMKLI